MGKKRSPGGQCDDGRCFRALPNCDTCGSGDFGIAANSNGVNFCTPTSYSQNCAGRTCTETADCPAGQFCEVICGGNHCATGCPA